MAIENANIALMNNNLSLPPYLIALDSCQDEHLSLAIFADVGMTIIVVMYSLRLFKFDTVS